MIVASCTGNGKHKPKPLTYHERMRWIRLALRRSTYTHRLHAPNTTMVVNWEADMLSVTSGGFIHEYEIKMNRKDYVADYKKYKHGYFRQAYAGQKPQRPLSKWMQEWYEKGQYSDEYIKNYQEVPWNYLPNYFWFVCAGFPITESEIPDYAGLIIIEENPNPEYGENPYTAWAQKRAPRLHGEEMTDKQRARMLTAMHYRYWKWAAEQS